MVNFMNPLFGEKPKTKSANKSLEERTIKEIHKTKQKLAEYERVLSKENVNQRILDHLDKELQDHKQNEDRIVMKLKSKGLGGVFVVALFGGHEKLAQVRSEIEITQRNQKFLRKHMDKEITTLHEQTNKSYLTHDSPTNSTNLVICQYLFDIHRLLFANTIIDQEIETERLSKLENEIKEIRKWQTNSD